MSSIRRTACLVAFAFLLAGPAYAENPNPGVLPIHSSPHGKTYGEWANDFWQWALGRAADDQSPFMDTTGEHCGVDQSGRVWFLRGPNELLPPATEIACTVPEGSMLFVPILDVAIGLPFGTTEAELRPVANFLIDLASEVEASIDGVPVDDAWSYRAESPFTTLHLPPGTPFESEGTGSGDVPFVTDGYWLMLAPLSRGSHTISTRAVIDLSIFVPGLFLTFETTYRLQVGPPG